MKTELFNKKIIISMGSGGVGKTTVAAGLGIEAARLGKKVLVLTIDPSKRLAQTLGIEGSNQIVKVPHQNFKGELFASVLEHKKVFDAFITRVAKNKIKVDKILANRLYQQLTTTLSGSQEFSALEMLYSCYKSNDFDLIILDTPPSKHAIDFLNAPQKLAALFHHGMTKWFIKDQQNAGFLKSVFQTGTKKVLQLFETITGSEFIHELSDFFENIQEWEGKLEEHMVAFQQMLTSHQTAFVLVTHYDNAKLEEAKYLASEIKKNGFNLEAVILNKSLPDWIDLNIKTHSKNESENRLLKLYENLSAYYAERSHKFKIFQNQISSYKIETIKIPEYFDEVKDLDGLEKLAATFRKDL